MADLIKRLQSSYPQASGRTVDDLVTEAHREFDGRPIRDFVPVLVERDVAERLQREHGPRVSVSA